MNDLLTVTLVSLRYADLRAYFYVAGVSSWISFPALTGAQ